MFEPLFDPQLLVYTTHVDNAIEFITVAAFASSGQTQLRLTLNQGPDIGLTGDGAPSSVLHLAVGDGNVIRVTTATSEGSPPESAAAEYTITVDRASIDTSWSDS